MTIVLALAMLQAAPAAEPPGELLFGFYRMAAFAQRATELGCGTPDKTASDAGLDALRQRLIARYGKKPFAMPKMPASGPGDCRVAVLVYKVNLADYARIVDAALAAPVPPALPTP